MKIIIYLLTILFTFFSFECPAEEAVKGKVIGTTQNKLSISTGECAVTDLGKNYGVTKGDIFKISEEKDPDLKGPIGRCAVLDVKEGKSTCEIVKMSKEIRKGNIVLTNKLLFSDSRLYPIIYDSLNKFLQPYEPYKKINVYIYNFFDEKNNITRFSEILKKEMKTIFSQKNRINLLSYDVGKGFVLYPEEYLNTKFVEDYMKRDDINVLIAGSYKTNNENIELTIVLIDKDYDDYQLHFTLKSSDYGNLISEVTVPYTPLERRDIICNLFYKPVLFTPQRDDKKYFVLQESDKNPFTQYTLGRIDFNIISPVDFKIKIGNNIINFNERNEYKLTLLKGTHRLSASFKRGFYYNDSLMYTSTKEIKKEILLNLEKGGEINIDLNVTPLYDKENIEFKIYKKTEREIFTLKPIYKTESINQLETYKD
ncbi:MAG: hypothetical protein NT010_12585 [Proteobacteria bacterium]|nr:hypothetical protein [Pseudomonadota bacterium]